MTLQSEQLTETPTRPKTLGEVIPEIEAMLAWAKKNPTLPAPYKVEMQFQPFVPESCTYDKVGVANIVRALPTAKKQYGDAIFIASHAFGAAVWAQVLCDRDTVCKRRVVGTKHIPERIVPAHTEEVVEWDCKPILNVPSAVSPAPAVEVVEVAAMQEEVL